jgi:hypothetical protein
MSRVGDESKYRARKRSCRRFQGRPRVVRAWWEWSALNSRIAVLEPEWDDLTGDAWHESAGRLLWR